MARWNLSVARFVLMMLLVLAWQGARADTAIRLLQSHAGNVNFVGTQKTIRDRSNDSACQVFGPAVNRSATLAGIPSTATILSAQLYWAGSGYNPDFNVIMDGMPVSAPSDRRYYSTTIGNSYNYFSGAADVTAQVKIKRNATYAFRGLKVDNDAPYCAVEGVLGGFSLVVIYSDPSQPFRMLNLYEGFQYMRYSGFTLNLGGFRVPDPIGTATGRIGHITWEGDVTLTGAGEDLLFNDYEMTDPRNPSGNQFNSKSSINGDDASYGIDFDAYTVGNPVIKSGQTRASTRYQSGQDLVLLSAEIVALPNIPLADLSIAMQLNGELAQGKDASYTITVTNSGPSIAANPNVVTSTLPAGLTYVSGVGAGWTCSNVGQDVTCSNNTALAVGAALPALKLTVRVTGTGTITTSALVTGKTFDPQTANNTANVKATVASVTSAYVFTAGECVDGKAFGDSGQTCTKTLPEVKAGEAGKIYITALSKGVPTGPAKDASVSMSFAISCHNPDEDEGVNASYAGKTLALCARAGSTPVAWSESASIGFKAGKPSALAAFVYDDVGLVELFAIVGADKTPVTQAKFVSVPYEIRLTSNGKALLASPLDETSAVFGKAGSPFNLEVGSYTGGSTPKLTPNFGNEKPAVQFEIPVIANGATGAAAKAMVEFPDKLKSNAFTDTRAGTASGIFSWAEVGAVKMTPVLNSTDYLGKPVTIRDAYVRFIPHHFTTSAKLMDCLPNMKCDPGADVTMAAYSLEPISVTVTAMADGDTPTRNYQSVFARNVTITAWAGAAKDQARIAGFTAAEVDKKQFDQLTPKASGTAPATATYDLLNPFTSGAPQGPRSAPTSIYLRADEVAGGDGVTSKSAGDAYEVGIRIVSGRLLVPNAHGSERLNLPVKVNAQYWTGQHWELSKTDDNRYLVDPAKAVFANVGGLSFSFASTTAQMLGKGVAGFSVKVTPAKAGSTDLLINDLPWLPSTKGRLKFGTYKSPLIYLRELH